MTLFSSCQPIPPDTETDELMLTVLETVLNDKQEEFYSLFWQDVLSQDAEERTLAFGQMRDYFNGEIVSWDRLSLYKHTAPQVVTVNCVYQVVTDYDTYHVQIIRRATNGESLVWSFNIARAEHDLTQTAPIGRLSDISQFTFFQWILFISNILMCGFITLTIIRCVRDKIKRKALFVIMTIVQFAFSLSVGSGVHTRFMIAPLSFAQHLVFPDGTTITTVTLPIGAIVYWLIRKVLIRKAENFS
jgi:hypothetical protein